MGEGEASAMLSAKEGRETRLLAKWVKRNAVARAKRACWDQLPYLVTWLQGNIDPHPLLRVIVLAQQWGERARRTVREHCTVVSSLRPLLLWRRLSLTGVLFFLFLFPGSNGTNVGLDSRTTSLNLAHERLENKNGF